MKPLSSCIYAGTVVHKRLSPKRHGFAYRVFSLCLDVDQINQVDLSCRLFSRNRTNLVSFHDRDHGAREGAEVGAHARGALGLAGLEAFGARIWLLCYPRLLGFVFNPLSTYFCYDATGRLGALIYEVSNTFGERTSYVLPVNCEQDATVVRQECTKAMYVSPFTPADARYAFHVRPPSADVVVGVALRDEAGFPLLKTHFRGLQRDLSDIGLLRAVTGHPVMTLKVVAAIHLQAALLWLKGIPVFRRIPSARHAMRIGVAAPDFAVTAKTPQPDPTASTAPRHR